MNLGGEVRRSLERVSEGVTTEDLGVWWTGNTTTARSIPLGCFHYLDL